MLTSPPYSPPMILLSMLETERGGGREGETGTGKEVGRGGGGREEGGREGGGREGGERKGGGRKREGDTRKEGGKEGKRIDMRRGERNRQSKEKRVYACSHRQRVN